MTQNQFDSALLDIIDATPAGKRVDMHAAMHTISQLLGGPFYEPGLWTAHLDNFTAGYPRQALRLRRRVDRGPRSRRSVNYNRAAVAYFRRFPEKLTRLVTVLSLTEGRVTVAQLRLAAGVVFNANFNHAAGKIVRRLAASDRWKLRVGPPVTVEM